MQHNCSSSANGNKQVVFFSIAWHYGWVIISCPWISLHGMGAGRMRLALSLVLRTCNNTDGNKLMILCYLFLNVQEYKSQWERLAAACSLQNVRILLVRIRSTKLHDLYQVLQVVHFARTLYTATQNLRKNPANVKAIFWFRNNYCCQEQSTENVITGSG